MQFAPEVQVCHNRYPEHHICRIPWIASCHVDDKMKMDQHLPYSMDQDGYL